MRQTPIRIEFEAVARVSDTEAKYVREQLAALARKTPELREQLKLEQRITAAIRAQAAARRSLAQGVQGRQAKRAKQQLAAATARLTQFGPQAAAGQKISDAARATVLDRWVRNHNRGGSGSLLHNVAPEGRKRSYSTLKDRTEGEYNALANLSALTRARQAAETQRKASEARAKAAEKDQRAAEVQGRLLARKARAEGKQAAQEARKNEREKQAARQRRLELKRRLQDEKRAEAARLRTVRVPSAPAETTALKVGKSTLATYSNRGAGQLDFRAGLSSTGKPTLRMLGGLGKLGGAGGKALAALVGVALLAKQAYSSATNYGRKSRPFYESLEGLRRASGGDVRLRQWQREHDATWAAREAESERATNALLAAEAARNPGLTERTRTQVLGLSRRRVARARANADRTGRTDAIADSMREYDQIGRSFGIGPNAFVGMLSSMAQTRRGLTTKGAANALGLGYRYGASPGLVGSLGRIARNNNTPEYTFMAQQLSNAGRAGLSGSRMLTYLEAIAESSNLLVQQGERVDLQAFADATAQLRGQGLTGEQSVATAKSISSMVRSTGYGTVSNPLQYLALRTFGGLQSDRPTLEQLQLARERMQSGNIAPGSSRAFLRGILNQWGASGNASDPTMRNIFQTAFQSMGTQLTAVQTQALIGLMRGQANELPSRTADDVVRQAMRGASSADPTIAREQQSEAQELFNQSQYRRAAAAADAASANLSRSATRLSGVVDSISDSLLWLSSAIQFQ